MMEESITLYNDEGVAFRQFPTSSYTLTINGSFIVLLNKQTRAIEVIFPSTAFSSIEVERA